MTYVSTPTAVSLNQFFQIMGFQPALFAGMSSRDTVADGNLRPQLFRYAWQFNDRFGHEDIARAIFWAEENLEAQLGFKLRPTFITNDVYWRKDYGDFFWSNGSGERVTLPLRYGYIQSGGTELVTSLTASTAVTYSGNTWSAAVTGVSETLDLSTVAVYFVSGDRLTGDARSESYRLRPVKLSLSGTTLTIRGSRWTMVKPSIMEDMDVVDSPLNADDSTHFVAQIEVVTITPQTNTAYVTLNWNAQVGEDADSDTGIFTQSNHREVIPYAATYENSAWTLQDSDTSPDKITLNYQAGYPTDVNGNVDRRLAQAVAWLACGYLPEFLGSNVSHEKQFDYWREYIEVKEGTPIGVPFSREDIFDNPFGTWRGAVTAWQIVKEFRQHGR